MAIELIEYDILTNVYNTNQVLTSDCNAITFYNTGTSNVLIDNVVYTPGAQLPIPGNLGEITHRTFNMSFDNTGVNSLTVYRKIYK